MAKLKNAKVERRKLAELKSYHEQADFFDDLSDGELEALANDIARNGLRELVEIIPKNNKAGIPPNTIVSGHQRAKALELSPSCAVAIIRN